MLVLFVLRPRVFMVKLSFAKPAHERLSFSALVPLVLVQRLIVLVAFAASARKRSRT